MYKVNNMARFAGGFDHTDACVAAPKATKVKEFTVPVHIEEVVTVTYVAQVGEKRRIRLNKQELIALRDALPAQYASLR